MRGIRLSLVLACLAVLPLFAGPIVAPGQTLFTIRTEHFDIIFPEASKPSALRLASLAEGVYDEVSAKLDSPLPKRVPVVITPDHGTFNGFMNPFPYTLIVLFDTPLPLEWTAFRDSFRALFLHELTHAVSLQVKAPWLSFVSGIFGSWVSPALLNSPMFMVEGVTVSFESADYPGGRANDPLVRQRIRQDILENRFKSPLEADALYDFYPYGSIYYEYGGLFSAYLQKRYGMEAYARLWKEMGKLILSLNPDPYGRGFYKAFRKVYGLGIEEAWAGFRQSLAILDVAEAPELLGRPTPSAIDHLAAGGGYLFWVDAAASRAWRLDPTTGGREALFDADGGTVVTDASADGKRLLVQRSLGLPDGRDRIATSVYDLDSRRFVPGGDTELRDARFYGKDLVGLKARLHNVDLVQVSPSGEKVLLAGSEELSFASPAVLADGRIALVVAKAGRRSLGILEPVTGKLSLVRPGAGREDSLDFIRQVSASGGRLWFNYDDDDRMYKLGRLEGGRILLEDIDRSGGVFMPVESGGRVYHVVRLSGGEAVARHEAAAGALAGTDLPFELVEFEPSAPTGPAADAGTAPDILPYRPLAYANPFNFWYLYPDLAKLDRSFRLLASFSFADPVQDNEVSLGLGYDAVFPFAEADLSWTNRSLPVAFTIQAGDRLVYGSSDRPERQTEASVLANLDLPLYPAPRALVLGLGGSGLLRAAGGGNDPYTWNYAGPEYLASAYIGYLGRVPGKAWNTARGLDLVSYHDYALTSGVYKAEAELKLSAELLPIDLALWGAWADEPILSLDSTSPVFAGDRRPAYVEYRDAGRPAQDLLAQGDISLHLFSQGVYASLLDLYVRRLNLDAGYRGAWFGGEYLHSAYARLSLDLGLPLGAGGGLGLRAFCEGFARLSPDASEEVFGWTLGLDLGGDLFAAHDGVDIGDHAASGPAPVRIAARRRILGRSSPCAPFGRPPILSPCSIHPSAAGRGRGSASREEAAPGRP